MIRKAIARHIGFPLQDKIKGTSIMDSMIFLKQSQHWNQEKIKGHQLGKLKELLEYAYQNVPYYSKLFNILGILPSDIRSFDDLMKIPVLTKETAREKNLSLVAGTMDKKKVKSGKTGGTTGAPLRYFKDTGNRSMTWGSYYRWYEWMGLEPGDPVVTFWGARTVLSVNPKTKVKDFLTGLLQNTHTINTFAINAATIPGIISRMNKIKPKLIKGYLSAIMEVAKYMDDNKLTFGFKPLAVSTTTETLLPPFRTFLERVFDCPVFDQYGCGEVSAIAYECAAHKGLHINMEHVYIELLDENGNPTLKNGRVVATDLDNLVMPFIRYDTGDIASMGDLDCTCGVSHPKLSSIDGRSIDTIILADGSKVHGVFFTDVLYELGIYVNAIARFQVYQDKPGEIEFRIEPSNDFDDSLVTGIRGALSSYFQHVNVVITEHLENDPSGKFRYVVSDVKKLNFQ